MQTCTATRIDGSPCMARALPARSYCWGHDPDLAEQRREKSAKGGSNKAAVKRLDKRTPNSLRPVLDRLYSALEGVADGTLTPQQGSSLASLASAIARIHETAELETRLAALEAGHAHTG